MPRAEVVRRFEDYVQRFDLPVQFGVDVTSVEPDERGYRVRANGDTLTAANVVVATGSYQAPVPPYAAELAPKRAQLHSRAIAIPIRFPGGVLVIGTGQSSCQIAEELYLAGRDVFLSVGTANSRAAIGARISRGG